MKNKWLIITLIVLLTIIIMGLVGLLVVSINGRVNFSSGAMSLGKKSSTIIFEKSYEIADINNIEIVSEAGDISFEKTTEENIVIKAYGENSENLKVELVENKLKIDYKESSKTWFNFNFYRNDIIVYIPESYLGEMNIKNDYGNIKVTDLENATINIDADCGNIEIGKVKNTTIKSDYGNIQIDSILNKCDIRSDCGNIEIKNAQIREDSKIESDLGNVDIDTINDIYVDAQVDLGNSNIKQNNRTSNITLEIKADCGNVNVGK